MKEINDIPEQVREQINNLVLESSSEFGLGKELQHLLTQLCYEMYVRGFDDGLKCTEKTIIALRNTFEGK